MKTNKHTLSTTEIQDMCKRLSYKYPNVELRGDLVSEATLSVYERLNKEPDAYAGKLYNTAKGAMHDYVNLKNRSITIPANPTTRLVAMGKRDKRTTYSDNGLRNIELALQPESTFNECFIQHTEDCTKDYEDKDYIEKGMSLLTNREKDIIKMRHYENMTQDDLAIVYGVTRQAISLWETEALTKMSKLK